MVVAAGSVTRCTKLMFLAGLGISRSLRDKSGGVLGDEHVLTGLLCAARCIESLAALWISHGGGGLEKWVDGCSEKKRGYVMKITKQRLAEGLSLP